MIIKINKRGGGYIQPELEDGLPIHNDSRDKMWLPEPIPWDLEALTFLHLYNSILMGYKEYLKDKKKR